MKFLSALLALLRYPVAITRITPLRLQPGDTIVLQVAESKLQPSQIARLYALCKDAWPNNKAVLLPADHTLRIVRTPPNEAA